MFERKNHLPNYLTDLFKLPVRKGLRASTYSRFSRILSNNTYADKCFCFCSSNQRSMSPSLLQKFFYVI